MRMTPAFAQLRGLFPSLFLVLNLGVLLSLTACTNLNALRQTLSQQQVEQALFNYRLDVEQTTLHFKVGQTRGQFGVFDAHLTFADNHIESGKLSVNIATGSVTSANLFAQGWLRGSEGFDATQHPLATFTTQTAGLVVVSDNEVTFAGELTVRDVTQPLTLTVILAEGLPIPSQKVSIPFTASGSFSRAEFGIDGLRAFAPDTVNLEVRGLLTPASQVPQPTQ